MATPKKSKRLAALLEAASGRGLHGPKCWGSRLSGEAKEFIAVVKARIKDGEFVNQARVCCILKTEFKLDIGASQSRQHLVGACRCK